MCHQRGQFRSVCRLGRNLKSSSVKGDGDGRGMRFFAHFAQRRDRQEQPAAGQQQAHQFIDGFLQARLDAFDVVERLGADHARTGARLQRVLVERAFFKRHSC